MKSDSYDSPYDSPYDADGPFTDEFIEALALDIVLQVRTEEQVLNEAQPRERVRLRALLVDPSFVASVQELRTWVGETRESLGDWKGSDDLQAQALSPQILQQTTRQQEFQEESGSVLPGVWGDAKVFIGFMRRRLASSVALRLAAASLIAHLIALPALAAYIYWVQPKKAEVVLSWNIGRDVLPEEILDAAPEEHLHDDSDLWSALGLHETNAIAGDRYRLAHMDWDVNSAGLSEPLTAWLNVRMERLTAGSQGDFIEALPAHGPVTIGHVLALELALDDWVMRGGVSKLEGAWFEPLSAWLQAQDPGQARVLGQLASMTLVRAYSYGLIAEPVLGEFSGSLQHAGGMYESLLGPDWVQLLVGLSAKAGPPSEVWSQWFQGQK